MAWKIITFILGLIPASILWFVGSQFLALFLILILELLWFADEIRNGVLGFSFLIIGVVIFFLWWRWVFKKEQKKTISNSVAITNMDPRTEKIKNITGFLMGIVLLGIVCGLSVFVINVIIIFVCWTSCNWGDYTIWLFGLTFLIFIFYSYKIWLSVFNKENSEKISQNNLSEVEK